MALNFYPEAELVHQHLIQEAQKYLLHTSYSISEIAYLLEFEYPNYFAKLFKKHIGLSPAPTLERVRKLEISGFIKSYHALVDEEKLGLGIKTFIQIQLDFHKNNTIQIFLDEVNQIKEVTECHHVTGQADFLLKVYVSDIKSYERLIMDKISKISVVKTFQTMMIMSTTKKEPIVPLEY